MRVLILLLPLPAIIVNFDGFGLDNLAGVAFLLSIAMCRLRLRHAAVLLIKRKFLQKLYLSCVLASFLFRMSFRRKG